ALLDDDTLARSLADHAAVFELTTSVRGDAALDGLADRVSAAMTDPEAAAKLLDGLRKSPARAKAIVALHEALVATTLFDAKWLAAVDRQLRQGRAARETVDALASRVETVEGVLRTRAGLAALPASLKAAVEQLVTRSVD